MIDIVDLLQNTSACNTLVLMPHVRTQDDKITSILRPGLSIDIDDVHRNLLQYAHENVELDTILEQGDEVVTALVTTLKHGIFSVQPQYESLETEPEAKWLVLEPHHDDAALSIGGLLFKHYGRAEFVVAGLISKYRYSNSAIRGDEEAVTKLRHQEEAIFCSTVGARKVDGGLVDADIRADGASPFREPTPEDIQMHRELAHRLFCDEKPDCVYVPMGAGAHVDHVSVHAAVIGLMPEWRAINPKVRVFIYEDLPYASMNYRGFLGVLDRLKKSQRVSPVFEDIADTLVDKVWAIGVYQSQPYQGFQRSVYTYASQVGIETGERPAEIAERLWELDPLT